MEGTVLGPVSPPPISPGTHSPLISCRGEIPSELKGQCPGLILTTAASGTQDLLPGSSLGLWQGTQARG